MYTRRLLARDVTLSQFLDPHVTSPGYTVSPPRTTSQGDRLLCCRCCHCHLHPLHGIPTAAMPSAALQGCLCIWRAARASAAAAAALLLLLLPNCLRVVFLQGPIGSWCKGAGPCTQR